MLYIKREQGEVCDDSCNEEKCTLNKLILSLKDNISTKMVSATFFIPSVLLLSTSLGRHKCACHYMKQKRTGNAFFLSFYLSPTFLGMPEHIFGARMFSVLRSAAGKWRTQRHSSTVLRTAPWSTLYLLESWRIVCFW